MNNRKPTWNYILNDIAFISLLTECLYSEYPSSQHKYDLEYQIKLIQDKLNKQKEVLDKIKKYINKHCVNQDVSKEVGYKCFTMADTQELEHIWNLLEEIE